MNLTFQIPMQYLLYLLDFTFSTRHIQSWTSFPLQPATSFLLQLSVIALHSSAVVYWTPSNLGGSSSVSYLFAFLLLSLGFSRQEYCSGLQFSSPVYHVLSALFTMSCPSWGAMQCMVHKFMELHKTLWHSKAVIHEGKTNIHTCKKKQTKLISRI